MSTGTTNILYWAITGLFSAFIIFSSMDGITLEASAVELMHGHLGYPIYFIRWISLAKLLGAIAILLPFVPARLKEWAYFGFFIDLATAVFSFIAVGDPVSGWAPMFLFFGVLVLAYGLYRKRLKARALV